MFIETHHYGRWQHPLLRSPGSDHSSLDAHRAAYFYTGALYSVLCHIAAPRLSRSVLQIWEELTQMLEEKLQSQEHYAACGLSAFPSHSPLVQSTTYLSD